MAAGGIEVDQPNLPVTNAIGLFTHVDRLGRDDVTSCEQADGQLLANLRRFLAILGPAVGLIAPYRTDRPGALPTPSPRTVEPGSPRLLPNEPRPRAEAPSIPVSSPHLGRAAPVT